MIAFDFVPLHEVADEIRPNVARHYREMTEGDDYGEPDINWDAYISASKAGFCKVVTVRDKGKLVGYAAYTIAHSMRYRNILEASSDGIFIEKEYRGIVSQEFLKKADEYLQKAGVWETNYTLSDDRVGHLLGRSGYQSKYKVWSRKYGK